MKAIDLANIVTTHFDYTGDLITNKKLQKLLYYIESWSLVYASSLIDEDFEAWVHGPVIPIVYQEFEKFGYSAIKNEYQEGESASSKMRDLFSKVELSQENKDLIFAVTEKYGSLSSYQLESLTHSEKPWIEARKEIGMFDHSTQIIDKEVIKSYYSSLIHE